MEPAPSAFTITIDGPAASGKSTTAARVADALDALHLNSGRLYRAITWAAAKESWIDSEHFGDRVRALDLELVVGSGGFLPSLGGTVPGAELDGAEVVRRVSEISARAVVRERVSSLLREAAQGRRVVCDGRDIGSVVFPTAELKIFLTASRLERARRRLLDYERSATPESLVAEAEALEARDRADSTRPLSPLRRPEDAVEIDTTALTPEQVVARIVEHAAARGLVSNSPPSGH